MAYAAQNPFALLGDDDDIPVVAPKAKAAPVAAAAPKAAAKPRTFEARAPRKVPGIDVNTEGPSVGEENKEERSANYGGRGGARGGRGGARGGRGGANPRSNGGTYLGGDRPRRENGGGRPFDKHSQTAHKDSEKNEAAGWGATEDGKKELDAEAQGEADAKTEAAPGTDAPAPRRQREDYTPAVEEEEEDNTQTYDEYLAAQASKKLNIALPTARVANEGAEDEHAKYSTALDKKGEVEQEWFLGAAKVGVVKATKPKVAKTFIEIETSYKPPKRDGPRDGAPAGGRGGRGGARGRGEGRGRGGARGDFAPRGAPRAPRVAAVNVADTAAFPLLV